ncbi:MAG: ATP-dependent sacrificial sulfur transferase LarE [Candidatus Omnitrophota bacterium]
MEKLDKLKKIIKNFGSVLVAYSGGVDSTFLLKAAHDVLGNKVLAVTAISATYPKQELDFARKMAKDIRARHRLVKTEECNDYKFMANPINRCYFCKKELFGRLSRIARQEKLKFVIDATSASDKKDFRPGNQAKKELGVRSPLEQAGITKEDIRCLSKKLRLLSWNKPAQACLASRIPYGVRISPVLLKRINQAELFLSRLGLSQVRLRHYNGLCRIEVLKNDIPKLISRRALIVEKLKKLGYNYVTVDLEGYRTGSLNEEIRCCGRKPTEEKQP